MAWSNNKLFEFLLNATSEQLRHTEWDSLWSPFDIVEHIVIAQERYISRLEGNFEVNDIKVGREITDLYQLSKRCQINDQKLIELAKIAPHDLTFMQKGKEVTFNSSIILAQMIHHATEHRAQIADIFSALAFKNPGTPKLDLDGIDLWSFDNWGRSN